MKALLTYDFWFRHLLYPFYNAAVGRDMFRVLAERSTTEHLSDQHLSALQLAKLRTVLTNAARHVPWYRRHFSQLGFDPATLRCLDEFRELEFTVSKQDVKDHTEEFLADNYPKGRLTWHRTGGSTGEPLLFPTDQATNAASAASFVRALRWWHCDIGQRHAMFWGSPRFIVRMPFDHVRKRTQGLRHWLMNRRFYANYDLNPENMRRYAAQLRRFRPTYVKGMASSLFLFARFLRENRLELGPEHPKVVFSACEHLYPWERNEISAGFNAPVANTYGLSEFGEIAFEAPCGGFHIMDEDVLVELLPLFDDPSHNEIVVTQLNNMASPLIRYRTGDIADSVCTGCSCGRGLRLLNGLVGRAHDFIVTPDGRYVHGQFFTHLLVFEKGIRKYQVVQEEATRFRILIERTQDYDNATEARVRASIATYLGPTVLLSFEYVDAIPLSGAGKHRWIVSKVAHRRSVT